jgi:hypothetical protein
LQHRAAGLDDALDLDAVVTVGAAALEAREAPGGAKLKGATAATPMRAWPINALMASL